jgi:L-alanine-DL-glutamate epimerase-like enolase superfamily enzyme
LDHIDVLFVTVQVDSGHSGIGLTTTFQSGRCLRTLLEEEIAPLLANENPLCHQYLAEKLRGAFQPTAWKGLAARAYSAVDLALWDLKGKNAGLPIHQLLGGARESTTAFCSDAGWLLMSPEQTIAASRSHLDRGEIGIKVQLGAASPEADAERVTRIREALGEDVWLAVDANERYDFATALSMGHFFEEEMGVDWFENPISSTDLGGYSRLNEKLEVPIAVGSYFIGVDEFRRFLQEDAVDVLRPDIGRLGGLTPCLEVGYLALGHNKAVVPQFLPEVSVHLACGLPNVRAVEIVSWLSPLFQSGPVFARGQLHAPSAAGLGLDVDTGAIAKFAI